MSYLVKYAFAPNFLECPKMFWPGLRAFGEKKIHSNADTGKNSYGLV